MAGVEARKRLPGYLVLCRVPLNQVSFVVPLASLASGSDRTRLHSGQVLGTADLELTPVGVFARIFAPAHSLRTRN